jgi:hypothetical protein
LSEILFYGDFSSPLLAIPRGMLIFSFILFARSYLIFSIAVEDSPIKGIICPVFLLSDFYKTNSGYLKSSYYSSESFV